jgi:hypothetical protein
MINDVLRRDVGRQPLLVRDIGTVRRTAHQMATLERFQERMT